jgi:surface protein
MFAVEVCSLPVTGGATGVAVAAAFLLVLGVIVARWVRASAGRMSVVAVMPLLLLGIGAASTQPSSTSCNSSTVTTTVPSVTTTVPEVTTTVPEVTTTTTLVPVDPNLVLQIDTSMQSGVGGASIGSMASSGSVSNLTTYDFELGLFGDVNVSIDWGDSTPASVATTAGVVSHTYATSGQYEIRVSGSLTGFGQDPDSWDEPLIGAEYLTGVSSFGDIGLQSLAYAFYGAVNLVSVPSVLPSTVVSLEGTFSGADSFNHANIGAWDTGNVTNMSSMFLQATAFNQSLSSWDTSKVTFMQWMFEGATSFDQSLNSWDTSSVTDMSLMFTSAASFNQSLNSWDTSKVTNMSYMFYEAYLFNGDVSNWDTGNVANMIGMFQTTPFNHNLNSWDTGNVTNMSGMFGNALSFNGDVSNWDTGKVTDMSLMFSYASSFNQSLSSWNISNVTVMTSMLNSTALSNANYAATLIGWANQTVKTNVVFGANGKSASGSAGCIAWAKLNGNPNYWVITDSSSSTCQ